MRIVNAFVLFLFITLVVSMPKAAESVSSNPGYITGEVSFPGFTTTSLSITAVGGGKTSQLTTYDSSSYQMTVEGGDWNYSLSSSCGLIGGNNNALTIFFNQRSLPVLPGVSVPNNYVYNAGIVRFQVNITGDPTTSSSAAGSWATKAVATGEKTATYSSGTPVTSARSYYWDLPVVPNQQIELNAKLDVTGASGVKRYSFSKSAASPYTLAPVDVAPGQLVIVPVEINFVEGETPPSSVLNKGTVAGNVSLLGLPSYNFVRHNANTKNLYANPAAHSREFSFANNQYNVTISAPTTYFDGSVDSSLRWPYINGVLNNNKVTVYPDTTTYLDFEREGGFLTGMINLSGAIQNEDLSAITFNFDGFGKIYDKVTKTWSYLDNYYGFAAVKRDATAANIKRPSVRDYKLFLTTGDWEMSSVTLTKQLSSPSRTSSVTFADYQNRYDGQTYFGTPIHIGQGANEKDFNYCFGSAIVRFWDAQGRLLKNPTVSGKGSHQTNGAVDLNVSSVSATSSEINVARPEVELFGPPANYNLTTLRVVAEDGTPITFPARTLSLSCNTTKMLDFPGPTLTVTSPQAELLTNAQSLPVSGRVFGSSTIDSVTVNGQTSTLTPVVGGSSNEVAFTRDLPLADGENLITVTATEGSGAQATDQLILFVDRWLPTVSINTPADGDGFLSTETSIPLNVEAADLGYGYTLAIYLDGTQIHSADGAGNNAAPVALAYDGILASLPVGEHAITATVSDRAGNSTSANLTISVYEPPPVLHGLEDQVIEATTDAGAVASFEVTATSTCNDDPAPVVFPSPALTAQSNSTTAGGTISKTFQWSGVTAEDGDAVQYQVQVSDTLDFATVNYNSGWQAGTTWTQTLPMGTWYWRVFARDSVHTGLESIPAVGNSFTIGHNGSSVTTKFYLQHHTDCTLSGGIYPDPGNLMWVGPFEGWDVDRTFLMFDTSTLGEGATITSTKLKLDFQNRDYMATGSVTNVHESTWAFPGDPSTYNNVGALLASQPIALGQPFGLLTFNIRPDYIEETGLTRFALAAADEDYDALWSSDPGYARATSYLEVTYLPSAAPWAAPTLVPQANAISSGENIATTFQWNEATAVDGDPVQYLVEISSAANFSTIDFTSEWQAATTWTQSLPIGTWYWRVSARDAVHNAVKSNPGASCFIIAYQPPPIPPGEVTITCSAASGEIFPLGATTVTCTARDACNRSAEGSFTIAVHDTMPPELALPAEMDVEATSESGALVFFNATSTDSVDLSPTVTCLPASGSIFPIGDTSVSCTARDDSGNATAGTFTVTVVATAPPVLTVPVDVTVEATSPLTTVDIGQATATHNLPVIISNDAPESYPVATTVVTWTATAANGKTASGVQKVTVADTTAPVVIAPANLTAEATGILTQINNGAATATDAVGVISITSDAPAIFPVGVTTVTWTATDAAGNTGTAVQTVTVTDLTPPVLDGLASQTLEAASAAGAVATFAVTASDLVNQAPTVICSTASGSIFPFGETTVTCSATDASGNSAAGSFTVTVRDTTSPVLTAPEDITVLLNTPLSSQAVQDFLSGATAVDTVDTTVATTATVAATATVTATATAPQVFDTVGAKQVTFTAVDDSGNMAIRTATIRVVYGCGEEFMEPVSLLKPFKLGSTVPVKIGFCDASGSAVTSAVVRLFLYPVSDDVPSEEPIEIQSPGSEDTGNLFKVSGDEYHYNLNTKNLAHGTYQVRAVLDDGTNRTVPLALK